MTQKHKIRHSGPQTPQLCGGKRCYDSKREAEQVKTEQELLTRDLQLAVYHCTSCGKYHLTRNVRSEEDTI